MARATDTLKKHPVFRKIIAVIAVFLMLPVSLWTFGAIYFDGPAPGAGNTLLGITWIALIFAGLLRFKTFVKRLLCWLALFLIVLLPWLLKQPSDRRDWSPEFARVPTATVDGDAVTFHNYRNFDYHADGSPIERWETRTVHLNNLRGMDFFLTYWGSEYAAHPIFSFDFGPEGRVAFSIEARREKDEFYTVVSGLYKLYEILYIVGDESDMIRLRTNFRKNENLYLYHLFIKQSTARLRFMEYVDSVQKLSKRPSFYNVITANCTTAVRGQITTAERETLDWRIIANGKLDELINEKGIFYKDMPFPELKRLSHINPAALANPDPKVFSRTIRQGLPGF